MGIVKVLLLSCMLMLPGTVAGYELTLLDKQQWFAEITARLVRKMIFEGYQVTLGRVHDCSKPQSLHCKKLAVDLNLFINGRYLKNTESHQQFGEFWESMGGSWGGRWGDGNHYSLGE